VVRAGGGAGVLGPRSVETRNMGGPPAPTRIGNVISGSHLRKGRGDGEKNGVGQGDWLRRRTRGPKGSKHALSF